MVRRVQGFDAVLIISQIICMQTFHYLLLAILLPPFIAHFTDPTALDYSGGPTSPSFIMDWREMASRSTAPHSASSTSMQREKAEEAVLGGVGLDARAAIGGTGREGVGERESLEMDDWDFGVDEKRGWIIAGLWLVVSAVDVAPLYYLIKKPTLILDFALTLILNHLILTIYHSGRFPFSFFFWLVMGVGSLGMIVAAEQLCVRRELRDGLGNEWNSALLSGDDPGESMEMNER